MGNVFFRNGLGDVTGVGDFRVHARKPIRECRELVLVAVKRPAGGASADRGLLPNVIELLDGDGCRAHLVADV